MEHPSGGTTLLVTFGEWLRAAMDAHGYKRQKDLELASGIPQQTISNMLNGRTKEPTFETIAVLTQTFGMDLNRVAADLGIQIDPTVTAASTDVRLSKRAALLKRQAEIAAALQETDPEDE